jgi:hypothetical protein
LTCSSPEPSTTSATSYTEAVDWLIAAPPTDEEIKQRLTEIAVQEIEGL